MLMNAPRTKQKLKSGPLQSRNSAQSCPGRSAVFCFALQKMRYEVAMSTLLHFEFSAGVWYMLRAVRYIIFTSYYKVALRYWTWKIPSTNTFIKKKKRVEADFSTVHFGTCTPCCWQPELSASLDCGRTHWWRLSSLPVVFPQLINPWGRRACSQMYAWGWSLLLTELFFERLIWARAGWLQKAVLIAYSYFGTVIPI